MITSNIIAGKASHKGAETIQVVNPVSKQVLPEKFTIATPTELDEAVRSAQDAFYTFRNSTNQKRGELLRNIADEIEALGDDLVKRVMQESGLPEGRVVGERGRTCNQLRMFAALVEEGSYVKAIIDEALPDRKPIPRDDIRKMFEPIGPVAVFGASNFPLAFSTAGGDTASALAAGCPVVVKAHPSHLGTNALVSEAIAKAIQKCNLPAGIYASLIGGVAIGQALVKHKNIKAVGFTGSQNAGTALMKIAAEREVPIPVYAEMGSINPVFILNEVDLSIDELASKLANSINLGSGQFCTNPGLIVVLKNNSAAIINNLTKAFASLVPTPMLNESIYENFENKTAKCLKLSDVAIGYNKENKNDEWVGNPAFISIDAKKYIKNKSLHEEVFGPFSVVVVCDDESEMVEIANTLEGQLTGTVFGKENQIISNAKLVHAVKDKVGRLIFNGLPTGVEVGNAMHHSGPFPAASNNHFTSVGTDAIYRFLRPQCYQNAPEQMLPKALQNNNPLGIWRLVNNEFGKR